jgi:replication factor C small subunit
MQQQEENSLWVEKYRPKNINEIVGNDDLKKFLKKAIKNQDIPQLLLQGVAGTGKTSTAKAIVADLDCDYIYINASDENNVETIRTKVKQFVSTIGFKKWKIVILDEADFLTPNAQAILRALTEEFSKSSRFILTCNYIEKIVPAIISRVQTFAFKSLPKQDMAMYVASILEKENIKFDLNDIVSIINTHYPDLRKIINVVDQYSDEGKLELSKVAEVEYGFSEKLFNKLNKKGTKKDKYESVRKFLMDNNVQDYNPLYRYLYEHIDELDIKSKAQGIIVVADAQYQDAFVVEHEINASSMILKLIDLYD